MVFLCFGFHFVFPPLFIPDLGIFEEPKPRRIPSRKFVRVPSFAAVELNILGKQTRREISGLAEIPLLRPLGQKQFKPFSSLLGKFEVVGKKKKKGGLLAPLNF